MADRTPESPMLPLPGLRPTKIVAFERELEELLRKGLLRNELDVMKFCFDQGMTRRHSSPILSKLKLEGVIALQFSVPVVQRWRRPRSIELKR